MIKNIKAKIIKDSRGNPTVEVMLKTDVADFVASVPAGASRGKNEAVALPAEKAVENINKIIAPKIISKEEYLQKELDNLMIEIDGTENKSKLGANAILAVSMAICRAGAKANGLPLYRYISALSGVRPLAGCDGECSHCSHRLQENCVLPHPCFNIVNGGAHAKNDLQIQEFMIIPQEEFFSKNLKIGEIVYKKLKTILKNKFGGKGIVIADEGGFSPPIFNDINALDFIVEAIGDCNVKIGLDCAASQFYFPSPKEAKENNPSEAQSRWRGSKGGISSRYYGHKSVEPHSDGVYKIDDKLLDKDGLIEFYGNIIEKYPVISIEDPFAEDDYEGFGMMMKNFGDKIIIVGDDFLTTNVERIKMAKEKNACNGAIIKPNQIGTISEAIEAGQLIKSFGWKAIVSHRSGETMDDFIADLSVGVGADFIKSGAPSRPERLAKYKRLAIIERQLNNMQ